MIALSLLGELSNNEGRARQLSGLRILVVDDDEDARELLQEVLQYEGADVETAADASSGFARLLEFKPAVIVSDIGMPGEDGYSFIRRCRQLPDSSCSHTPAIAVTAFTRPEDRLKSREAGFDAHVGKPVDLAKLVATIVSLASGGGATPA